MPEIFDILLSFITLSLLEIILGIDNLVFLSIVSQKLPKKQQKSVRQVGLFLALILRLLLLFSAVWIAKLTTPLFTINEFSFSVRDLFLLLGGIFLIVKATQEIHNELEIIDYEEKTKLAYPKFSWVVLQITLLDVVFSLDSILTAIALTQRYWLMVLSIVLAILTMLFLSEPLSKFIEKHPTIKMLALSFLILIGTALIADGFHFHIPRGYIYFAMGFSIMVEVLNIIYRNRSKKLRG